MPASQKLKETIEDIIKLEYPGETVDVSDGYANNIHIVVVSRKFDGMAEKEKQDMLWSFIDKSKLSDEEKLSISLILPYSPKDLK
jgi:acid stress-induced BolA-like protein IbaG/YrbA